MSDFATHARAADDRVSRAVGTAICQGLTLGAITMVFAVSPMMLYDWGFKYGDEGGSLLEKVHPGAWLALMAVVAQGLGRGNPIFVLEDFARSRAVAFYLLCVAGLFAFTILVRKQPFTPWIDTFVLPALIYGLIEGMSGVEKRRVALIIHAVLIANAALGLYENQTGYRLTSYVAGRFVITDDWRATALLGHPLANALSTGAYVIALSLGGGRELPAVLRPVVIGLELVALIAFGGRTSLVATLVILAGVGVFQAFRLLSGARFSPVWAGLSFLGFPVALAILAQGAGAGFFDQMLQRFIDDNGSASARVTMLQLFDYISWPDFLFGPDPDFIGHLQYSLGIEYGIESFWIAFVIMNGLLFSLLFFAGLGAFSWRLANVTRPATYVMLGYYYFVASTSVSMSTKTTTFAIFVAMALVLMRVDPLVPGGAAIPTSRPS